MSAGSDGDAPGRGRRVADLLEREPVWAREFTDPRYEWRRWFSELFGTFLLVLAGGGAPVVDTLSQGAIGRVAAAAAPALTVLAVILFMGAVSGAHLNPVVTIAFSLRADVAWRRVPGYLAAQLVGAVAAAPCSGRCSASTPTRRSRCPAPGSRSVRRLRSRPCAASAEPVGGPGCRPGRHRKPGGGPPAGERSMLRIRR
jgi:hypothetical protein